MLCVCFKGFEGLYGVVFDQVTCKLTRGVSMYQYTNSFLCLSLIVRTSWSFSSSLIHPALVKS